MRVRLKKGQGTASDPAGTWYAWQRQLSAEDPSDAAKVSAIDAHNKRAHGERPVIDIVCPVCGKCFFLESGERNISAGNNRHIAHGVTARGEVFPSVVCPWGCRFHSFVFLEDWTHGELQEVV